MPPPTFLTGAQSWQAVWPVLHGRWQMACALLLSVAFHLSAYIFTPHLVSVWHEATAARYDAVLLPASNVHAAEEPPVPAASASKPRRRSSTPARARTVAGFVAPENAIAVDYPAESIDNPGKPADDLPAPPPVQVAATTMEEKPAARTPAGGDDITDTAAGPELPSRIAISYHASSSVTPGVADYSWKRDGNRYEVDSTLRATGIIGLLAASIHQVSRGEVTGNGLRPDMFTIRRGQGEPEIAEFLRVTGEIKLTRGGSARMLPLPAKIQDMQSFLFQLAFDAAKLKTPDDRLDVLVTNARKVYRHRFKLLGEETVETSLGPIVAMHLLSEAADPEDAYEVWLSPGHFHLPVKLRFFAGRFPIELIATSIRSTP